MPKPKKGTAVAAKSSSEHTKKSASKRQKKTEHSSIATNAAQLKSERAYAEPEYAVPEGIDPFSPALVPKSNGKGTDIPGAHKTYMLTCMKDEVWRRIQFVGDDGSRSTMVEMWLGKTDLYVFKLKNGKVDPKMVRAYTNAGQKYHNRQRSDTVAKIKTVCDIYYEDNGKKSPSIEALEKIVHCEKDADGELFVWW